jgi:hypothetical protein
MLRPRQACNASGEFCRAAGEQREEIHASAFLFTEFAAHQTHEGTHGRRVAVLQEIPPKCSQDLDVPLLQRDPFPGGKCLRDLLAPCLRIKQETVGVERWKSRLRRHR